jgi:hypothetical protein
MHQAVTHADDLGPFQVWCRFSKRPARAVGRLTDDWMLRITASQTISSFTNASKVIPLV